MANQHGDFIWYELLTSDADAAQEFYGKLLGWTFIDSGTEGMDYRLFSTGGALSDGGSGVGGLMAINDEMAAGGARPCWLGYINVSDVDASATAIKDAGGSIYMDAQDIPDVGRIAMVADPQGAMFYIMTPANKDETSGAFSYAEPKVGHCAWNELATSDQSAAVAFYTEHFGWKQEGEMDMGPMGAYQFLHHGQASETQKIGAVMPRPEEMPVSAWTYYFRVADIDAAVEIINANGGKILHDPSEIPGDEFQVSAMDPQGAYFALVGQRK